MWTGLVWFKLSQYLTIVRGRISLIGEIGEKMVFKFFFVGVGRECQEGGIKYSDD